MKAGKASKMVWVGTVLKGDKSTNYREARECLTDATRDTFGSRGQAKRDCDGEPRRVRVTVTVEDA